MLAIGLDFGTLSVRALAVDTQSGAILATAVAPYARGVIDQHLPEGNVPLGPEWALQSPSDWLNSMAAAVRDVVAALDNPAQVVGLGIDFTSCTVLPVRQDGLPLCQIPEMARTPHAWPKLWKHHAAQPQATRITELAAERGEKWLPRYGGVISSEWLLPKALQILEEAPDVYAQADLIVEGGDWVAWQLTGHFVRNACAAGFKGLWHKVEGYPSEDYLRALNPDFADFYSTRGAGEIAPPGDIVGTLTAEWAERLGLRPDVKVAVGIIDAHAGAIGGGVAGDGMMYMAMGTSTCHMLVASREVHAEGISGVVEDGILPGWFGYEAGQVAVGDIFNWYTQHVGLSHDDLTARASALRPGESGLLALDWWNGCRTPLVDAELSGVVLGYNLQTPPEAVYRALIEATAFGTQLIVETFADAGLPTRVLRAGGGLTKNDMLPGIYADVTGLPLEISATEHASALGAAILGAVAGGAHATITDAIGAMVPPPGRTVRPQEAHRPTYQALYAEYRRLVDLFGRDPESPLKRLRALRPS